MLDLKLSDLSKDGAIVQIARDAATAVLKADPELHNPDNEIIRRQLDAYVKRSGQWGRIS